LDLESLGYVTYVYLVVSLLKPEWPTKKQKDLYLNRSNKKKYGSNIFDQTTLSKKRRE